MLNKIIEFSIKNKFIIGIFTMMLILWGVYSASRLPIDALPDITNNQVQVITTSPSLATQEVEKFITYPIELELKSIPGIVELRSVSRFGLSLVTVVFEEDIDIYWARTQIMERLKNAEENIPEKFGIPFLAPVSTGLGEIYQYTLYADEAHKADYSLMDIRSIQDWTIVPQLLGTKGVAEVNTLGGKLKEYEVAVQPDKLKSLDVTMIEIFNALEQNNENTGGAYIDKKPNAYYIRGVGMVTELEDLRKIVVKEKNGIPVLIRDIAEVRFGSAIRYGATTKDGKGEVVSGMVMMLKGQNSAEVIKLVKEKIEIIKETLPEGIIMEPFLDRSKLVDNAISTVQTNLIEGALIVIFILVLLIGNWRAGLIVASVIPLSLLFAISLMRLFGVSGNLMSLGAIDFGLIVDGAVIIVEAIVHRLQKVASKKALSQAEMDVEVYTAASKIRTSAAFGEIIILIVYLPILVLVGIEGKMFGPMAQTVSFAILGAFILSLTYIPMMSSLFLNKTISTKQTFSDKIIQFLNKYYQKLLIKAFEFKGLIIGFSIAAFIGALLLFNTIGGEFIPTLEEGDLATHIIIPPGSSLEQEIATTTKAEKLLMDKFPEIEQSVSKIGSAEVPTDPMPMEVADVMLILKPKKEWTSAKTKEELVHKMEEALDELPGVTTEFSQPIQMRFNELMTGVRSDVGIKIFGEDFDLLIGYGDKIVNLLQGVEGIENLRAETVSGLPQISINYDKDKLALYGLNVGELNQLVQMGFAGSKAGVIYEGEKRYDLVVRMEESSRKDIANINNMYIPLSSGNQIPLEEVADIVLEKGPAQISREQGKRRIIIGFNVRGKDVQTVVEEIQLIIKENIDLPDGYYTEYSGQFQNLVEANKRLSIAVPIALFFILILLYFTFKNMKQSLLIFTAIPLSAIGGVLALWIRDMPFSISAGVGFIALFGVAVLNGIVLIGYFNQLKEEGMTDIIERIKVGTQVRLRPVIMTAAVASLGFLPMAMSNSAGAEVQKPLATVVIGGLITATLLTLILLPILYYYIEKINWKFSIKKASIIILFLSVGSGFAQNSYNLEQAIAYGLSHNLTLKNQELKGTIATENLLNENAFGNTNIQGNFGQINSTDYDHSFNISQSFNPFLIFTQKQLIEQSNYSNQLKLEIAKQALVYKIRSVWNTIIYYQTLSNELSSQDSIQSKFLEITRRKFELGDINSIEKTNVETQTYQLKQKKLNSDWQIKILTNQLKELLFYKGPDFSIESKAFLAVNFVVDTSDIKNNLSLGFAIKEIELAIQTNKVQKANLYPEFELGYFMQSMQGDHVVDGNVINYGLNPNFNGITVGLSIPLFATKEKSKARIAKINIEAKENESEILKNTLNTQFHELIDRLINVKENLSFYENIALPNCESVISKAQFAYENGEISYIEFARTIQLNSDVKLSYLETIKNNNQIINSIYYLINQ